MHVDHIVPRSKGGTNDDDNLQTLCQKCNLGKSNLDDTNLREL
ncbi:MAG: HNH endonuclease [Thermoguttaceae bacterium]